MRKIIIFLLMLILISNAADGTFIGNIASAVYNGFFDLISPFMPIVIIVLGIIVIFRGLF